MIPPPIGALSFLRPRRVPLPRLQTGIQLFDWDVFHLPFVDPPAERSVPRFSLPRRPERVGRRGGPAAAAPLYRRGRWWQPWQ